MPTPLRIRLASQALVLGSVLILGPFACASAGSGQAGAPAVSSADVITQKELSDIALADKSVLEAIQRLRPRFLQSRSSSVSEGSKGILMSLDGANPQDGVELARISVAEVAEIRYLNAGEANMRFGMAGTGGPVILVTRKH